MLQSYESRHLNSNRDGTNRSERAFGLSASLSSYNHRFMFLLTLGRNIHTLTIRFTDDDDPNQQLVAIITSFPVLERLTLHGSNSFLCDCSPELNLALSRCNTVHFDCYLGNDFLSQFDSTRLRNVALWTYTKAEPFLGFLDRHPGLELVRVKRGVMHSKFGHTDGGKNFTRFIVTLAQKVRFMVQTRFDLPFSSATHLEAFRDCINIVGLRLRMNIQSLFASSDCLKTLSALESLELFLQSQFTCVELSWFRLPQLKNITVNFNAPFGLGWTLNCPKLEVLTIQKKNSVCRSVLDLVLDRLGIDQQCNERGFPFVRIDRDHLARFVEVWQNCLMTMPTQY